MYLYTTKTKMPEENKENLNQDIIKNWNPYDLVDHPNNPNQNNENNINMDTWKKEPGKFLRKLIKTIAKMAWLPDPETGKPAKDSSVVESTNKSTNETSLNSDTTLEQDVIAQEEQETKEEEKKKFSFENVMSGVTWVLDKIEKKVEEKTWIDLDAPLKKREEKLNDEESQTEPEIEVDKNNEEYLSENH